MLSWVARSIVLSPAMSWFNIEPEITAPLLTTSSPVSSLYSSEVIFHDVDIVYTSGMISLNVAMPLASVIACCDC
jgi:hypothetical protein